MNLPAAPIRVLLVEPDADTRELYDVALRAAGFQVFPAHDAASAMIAFATHTPAIVVSETRLPDRSAAELLTRFSDAGVPVVALTTDPLYQHHDSRAAGLAAVLMKPCLPDEVVAVIRVALGGGAHGGTR